ncbi:hypothetical protein POKO110462_12225 [Pontibacter korlensis]
MLPLVLQGLQAHHGTCRHLFQRFCQLLALLQDHGPFRRPQALGPIQIPGVHFGQPLEVLVRHLNGLRRVLHDKAFVGLAIADPVGFFQAFRDKRVGLVPDADEPFTRMVQRVEKQNG